VSDGVGQLRPPRRLEVGQEIELASVVGAVASAAQRHDAERVAAAAQRPRDQMRGVDSGPRAADDARPSGDRELLLIGRRQ
jgi:hypothetical protein